MNQCDVIRDLLTLYADGLTSISSNEMIEEHLQSCDDCKSVLEQYNQPIIVEPFPQKEVDYLKKVKKRIVAERIRLLIIATAISLIIPTGFLTNPLRFVGIVSGIWLILFLLSKAFSKLVFKKSLLIIATAISLIAGLLTIKKGAFEHIYYFGFPNTFLTLHRPISEFPAGLGINPIQFVANVGVIWLILFLLSEAFRKIVLMVRKKKDVA